MNSIINMNILMEKELELERQGTLRRTRRWIGDASQVTDDRWYRRKVKRIPQNRSDLDEISRAAESKPRRKARHPLPPRARRQPACSEC